MRLALVGMMGSGLCAWLMVGAAQPDPPADPLFEAVGPGLPGWLAQADERPVDSQPYLPAEPPPRWGREDRPGRGPMGGPLGRGGAGLKPPRRGPGTDDEWLSPEQPEKILQFVRPHFPKLAHHLGRLRESDPEAFRRAVDRLRGPLFEIARAMEHDPEAAKKMIQALRIEIELAELQRQYQAPGQEPKREQVKARIREKLEERFDLRLERLRRDIRELEKRLDEAKRQLADRERDKDAIIGKELDRVLSGAAEPLPEHPPPPPPERPGRWQRGQRGSPPPAPQPDQP